MRRRAATGVGANVRRLLMLVVAVMTAAVTVSAQSPAVWSRTVFLMGTRATLAIAADDADHAAPALERALRVLEAAEDELSTWRPHSQVSQLNRATIGAAWTANPQLCSMFSQLDHWQRATRGAFDPALGVLIDAWDVHGNGRVPSPDALARARASSGWSHLRFSADACELTRLGDVRIDVGAFGKGEALDRAATILPRDVPWMIDLGGQVMVGGIGPAVIGWPVAIAHPLERERSALDLRLRHGSLSTSAGSERDLRVDGTRVGHILDPRTGEPAAFTGSVTVWHDQALAADVLSTALYVMGPERGLAWAASQGVEVCYLIPIDGRLDVRMSEGFRALLSERE